MKKKTSKKLEISKETLRMLESRQLQDVPGATGGPCATAYACTQTCYCTTNASHCTA